MFKHILLIACAIAATVVPYAAGVLAGSAASLAVFTSVTIVGLFIGFVGVAMYAAVFVSAQAEG